MSWTFLSWAVDRRAALLHGMGFAAVTMLITLLFFRAPEPSGGESNSSSRMMLDLSFRPAATTGLPVQTLDGPLVPLQHPIYVGRSIWRSITWQIAGNLAMAAIVTAGCLSLEVTRRWWALTLFVVFGISHTSVAPWLALFVLGSWAGRGEARILRFLCGVGLGILGLTSIAHLLLSIGAVAFSGMRRDRVWPSAASIGFGSGLLGTWLLLGQSPVKLGQWLWFGLTKMWTSSSLVLMPATTASFTWAGWVLVAWIAIILINRKSAEARNHARPGFLFISWGAFLAWKLLALQPAGTPLLFFITVLCGGFLLLPRAPAWAALAFALGVIGASRSDRIVVTDAVGRINRRLLQNLQEFQQLPGLRESLRRGFTGYGSSFTMPLTRGVLAGETVGVIGDSAMQAILNEFRVSPSTTFGTRVAQDIQAIRPRAESVLHEKTPSFWLLRMDCDNELLPALRDGPAQLALYLGYDFVLNEQGLSLWKKKDIPVREAPQLIQEGTVKFGETLSLPRSGDRACWLELDCSPNWAGLIRDQLKPLVEPALRAIDLDGNELRYALPWRMARAGFLARPFFRGDSDLWQFEEGEMPPQLRAVTVELPSHAGWAWRSDIRYRIYQLPAVLPARVPGLTAQLKKQYAALNRVPASVSGPFAPMFGVIADKPALFMHPDSVMELTVTAAERVVQGSLGIAPDAYAKPVPNVTDGVSFSIEFIAASGKRTVLLQRDLDPATTPDDRGPQLFRAALPASNGGRLLFRTFNLPGKTSSFDWSYWREIELK